MERTCTWLSCSDNGCLTDLSSMPPTLSLLTTSAISNKEQNIITTTICTQNWDDWKGDGQKNNLIVVHPQHIIIIKLFYSCPNYSTAFQVSERWLIPSNRLWCARKKAVHVTFSRIDEAQAELQCQHHPLLKQLVTSEYWNVQTVCTRVSKWHTSRVVVHVVRRVVKDKGRRRLNSERGNGVFNMYYSRTFSHKLFTPIVINIYQIDVRHTVFCLVDG